MWLYYTNSGCIIAGRWSLPIFIKLFQLRVSEPLILRWEDSSKSTPALFVIRQNCSFHFLFKLFFGNVREVIQLFVERCFALFEEFILLINLSKVFLSYILSVIRIVKLISDAIILIIILYIIISFHSLNYHFVCNSIIKHFLP